MCIMNKGYNNKPTLGKSVHTFSNLNRRRYEKPALTGWQRGIYLVNPLPAFFFLVWFIDMFYCTTHSFILYNSGGKMSPYPQS